MTTYSMTPISNGTRLRTDHNTFASVITSYNANELVSGDLLWEAPADGSEVKKGDKWLHVTHRNGNPVPEQGWMAYIHKSQFICDNFEVIEDVPDPEPEVPVFPEYFILTDPQGNKSHYEFVGILP
jgi:hypothetical protein